MAKGVGQVGFSELGTDDHHGQGGVQVAQEGEGRSHGGRKAQAAEKAKQPEPNADNTWVEHRPAQGEGRPASHDQHAQRPTGQVEGQQGQRAVDQRLLPEDGLDQGEPHEADVAVDGGKTQGVPGIRRLPPEEQQGDGEEEQIAGQRRRRADRNLLRQGGGPLHQKAVHHHTGTDDVEQQVRHLAAARLSHLSRPAQHKTHRHHQKQSGHLSGDRQQIGQHLHSPRMKVPVLIKPQPGEKGNALFSSRRLRPAPG